MSCNYYIHTKDSEMAFDFLPRVEMDEENREFIIHLCQTILSKRAIFECHGYSSFSELEERLLNKNYAFSIKDEYGKEFTPEEFITEMRDRQLKMPRREDLDLNETGPWEIITDSEGFDFMDIEFS